MGKEPTIGRFLDNEERALFELTESEDFDPPNELTPARLDELQAAAGAAPDRKQVRISVRLAEADVLRLKASAVRKGIPYHTLIESILHDAAVRQTHAD